MSKDKKNVIPFPRPKDADGAESPFDGLVDKLEGRLNTIEEDLKSGLEQIQEEVEAAMKARQSDRKDLKKDIEGLAKYLEARMHDSVTRVMKSRDSKVDKDELSFITSLVGQMSQFLSSEALKEVLRGVPTDKLKPSEEVDAFGMDTNFRLKLKPFFDFLYFKYWRVQTTGIENVPDEGRGLIVGNHSGALPYDGAMIGITILNEHAVREDARFLVENFVYYMPFLGSYMYRLGGVRACPENAERLLENEKLLVVFPEGVKGLGKYYKDRYQLQRFGRGGFVRLCIKTKSPLIPVGIVGAEEIHPILYKSNTLAKLVGAPYIPITPTFPLLGLLGLIPLPSKWFIHFGEPMNFEKYSLDTLNDGITIHELSENVRVQIQEILINLLKQRKSVWTG